ncbi:PIN domain-containing protein [Candidatus Korobacter versatilis]|nr:PIN domain-containing protein [Candidatus Koribacter versatilis]
MRIGLDTNVLFYAEGLNGEVKQRAILDILTALPQDRIVVPVQCLGEFFHALVRKGGYSRREAQLAVMAVQDSTAVADTTAEVLLAAADLAAQHQFTIWDSVVMAAASRAGCRLLLSEDLQDGFTWSGLTIANPLAAKIHPLLESLLH